MEKCRITFEARQAISGYFSGDPTKIQGHILPSVIVLKGSWGNLQNIDENGRFKKDENFYVGDVMVEHKMGKKTQKMASLVALRTKRPELFEKILVHSQPSAWVDEVINGWLIEDLGQRVPQAVHQRDLFGVMLTESSKQR